MLMMDRRRAFLAMIAIPNRDNTPRAANLTFNRPNRGRSFFKIFFFFPRSSTIRARTVSLISSGIAFDRLREAPTKSQLSERSVKKFLARFRKKFSRAFSRVSTVLANSISFDDSSRLFPARSAAVLAKESPPKRLIFCWSKKALALRKT